MPAPAPHVRVAEGKSFAATSRVLFGPITQRFGVGARPVAPRLTSVSLGGCRLSEITADAHIVEGDQFLRRSFDPDSVKILMQLSGRSRFEQQSIAVDIATRAGVIYDPVRSYSLQNLSTVDQLILQVPRATFNDDTLARLEKPVPLTAGDDSFVRIVSGIMQMAIGEAERLDIASRQRLGDSLVQLVSGLIRGEPVTGGARRTPLEALRERIISYVEINLAQRDLSPDEIARRMGCSRRYVHRAFEGTDVTLERLIWDRRLEKSRDALLSPENSKLSISEIAFSCGFNSSAHFSRAFRTKFEIAPSERRQRLRKAVH